MKEKKSKAKQKLGTWILVFIIIIAAICLIVNLTQNNNNNKPKQSSQSAQQNTDNMQEVKEKYVEVLKDGTRLNISTNLAKEKNVNGLIIENIRLFSKDNLTTLQASVKNNTGKDIGATAMEIILIDEEGNEIVKTSGWIQGVKAGETAELKSSTTLDYANAYDFKVVIK